MNYIDTTSRTHTASKRILFVGEHLTTSHYMRPWHLACTNASLREQHTIHFASSTLPTHTQETQHITLHRLPSPGSDLLKKRIGQVFVPLYTTQEIETMVEAEKRLLDSVQPDLVIHDFRNTLAISMARSNIPLIALSDFYWGRQYENAPVVPDNPFTKLFGHTISNACAQYVEPFVESIHIKPFNTIARRHHATPFENLRDLYNRATKIWYMDLPQILPFSLSPDERCIGPILWDSDVSEPSWLNSIKDHEALCITFGTNGNESLVQELLRTFRAYERPIIVLTAGRIKIPKEDGVYVCDFAPLSKVLAKTEVLICHGGSSFLYPALRARTPCIGIPSNITQWYAMRRFHELKLGTLLPQNKCTKANIQKTLESLQKDTECSKNISALQSTFTTMDPLVAIRSVQ